MIKFGKFIVLGEVDMQTVGEIIRGQQEKEDKTDLHKELVLRSNIKFGEYITSRITPTELEQLHLFGEL